MGRCLEKLPHSCGSNSGLQVFEAEDGSINGFCYACGKFVDNPYGEELSKDQVRTKKKLGKTPEEIEQEMEFISTLGCVDLPKRKLRKVSLEKFGIKIGYSESDGKTPRFAYFPYTEKGEIVKYKVKLLDTGKVWSVGKSNNVDLFGWEQAKASGAKRLIIVEGEFDAPALDRIADTYSKEGFKDYLPAVCSIPNGAGNAKRDLSRLLPEIRKHFKDISFCFDNDEAGEKATKDACTICPEAKVITLPAKDANDCILQGKGKAAHKAMTFNQTKHKNSSLLPAYSLHQDARKPPKVGELTWPWPRLNKTLRGIRKGETCYIGAGVKCGKSTILNEIVAHHVKGGVKTLLAKPEEAVRKTYKMVAGAVAGKIFHDPDVEFDYEAYDRAGQVIKDRLFVTDVYQNLSWENLKSDIIMGAGEGVEVVHIDPITVFTNGMGTSDINTFLQGFAQEVAALALDLDIFICLYAHLNTPSGNITKDQREKYYNDGKYLDLGGCPHELGGSISSMQFAGSRGMARSCNIMLGLLANKDEDLPENVRNVRRLKILEEREFGVVGSTDLYYQNKTGKYQEI